MGIFNSGLFENFSYFEVSRSYSMYSLDVSLYFSSRSSLLSPISKPLFKLVRRLFRIRLIPNLKNLQYGSSKFAVEKCNSLAL